MIIHALKMWRQYLLGKTFVLMSDHSGLTYLLDQPNLNAKQARWLVTLNEFNFKIRYIKGKENRVIESLSRKVHVNNIETLISYVIDLHDLILQEEQKHGRYMELMHRLHQGTGG